MLGMRAALRRYLEEGPENALERQRVLSAATKEGVRALGLDLSGDHPERAWAVTAIHAPEGIDGDELVAKVRQSGVKFMISLPSRTRSETLFMRKALVRNLSDAQAANTERYGALFRHLLERGIYFPPSQFEALFISTVHGDDEIERTVQAVADFDD